MFKTILVASICFSIFTNGEGGAGQPNTSDRLPVGYYEMNNIPQVEVGCEIRYDCRKKLKHAEYPKPCIKFCVKNIVCENGKRTSGQPHQCLELNEELVTQEYNDCKKDEDSNNVKVMSVAMIDFPCQPGYLPDSRGRCREVW